MNSKTHREYEYKFLVSQVDKMRSLLEKLDQKRVRVWERTIMFDNRQGLMAKTNGRVRLRIRKPGKSEFSYKRPVFQQGVKVEIEYETKIENHQALMAILQEMGFTPTTSYERYRTTYQIGGCKVTLDEYPFAVFVEIEGTLTKINKVAKLLGFDPEKSLDEPCDTLYTKWCLKQGRKPKRHMRFGDY